MLVHWVYRYITLKIYESFYLLRRNRLLKTIKWYVPLNDMYRLMVCTLKLYICTAQ